MSGEYKTKLKHFVKSTGKRIFALFLIEIFLITNLAYGHSIPDPINAVSGTLPVAASSVGVTESVQEVPAPKVYNYKDYLTESNIAENVFYKFLNAEDSIKDMFSSPEMTRDFTWNYIFESYMTRPGLEKGDIAGDILEKYLPQGTIEVKRAVELFYLASCVRGDLNSSDWYSYTENIFQTMGYSAIEKSGNSIGIDVVDGNRKYRIEFRKRPEFLGITVSKYKEDGKTELLFDKKLNYDFGNNSINETYNFYAKEFFGLGYILKTEIMADGTWQRSLSNLLTIEGAEQQAKEICKVGGTLNGDSIWPIGTYGYIFSFTEEQRGILDFYYNQYAKLQGLSGDILGKLFSASSPAAGFLSEDAGEDLIFFDSATNNNITGQLLTTIASSITSYYLGRSASGEAGDMLAAYAQAVGALYIFGELLSRSSLVRQTYEQAMLFSQGAEEATAFISQLVNQEESLGDETLSLTHRWSILNNIYGKPMLREEWILKEGSQTSTILTKDMYAGFNDSGSYGVEEHYIMNIGTSQSEGTISKVFSGKAGGEASLGDSVSIYVTDAEGKTSLRHYYIKDEDGHYIITGSAEGKSDMVSFDIADEDNWAINLTGGYQLVSSKEGTSNGLEITQNGTTLYREDEQNGGAGAPRVYYSLEREKLVQPSSSADLPERVIGRLEVSDVTLYDEGAIGKNSMVNPYPEALPYLSGLEANYANFLPSLFLLQQEYWTENLPDIPANIKDATISYRVQNSSLNLSGLSTTLNTGIDVVWEIRDGKIISVRLNNAGLAGISGLDETAQFSYQNIEGKEVCTQIDITSTQDTARENVIVNIGYNQGNVSSMTIADSLAPIYTYRLENVGGWKELTEYGVDASGNVFRREYQKSPDSQDGSGNVIKGEAYDHVILTDKDGNVSEERNISKDGYSLISQEIRDSSGNLISWGKSEINETEGWMVDEEISSDYVTNMGFAFFEGNFLRITINKYVKDGEDWRLDNKTYLRSADRSSDVETIKAGAQELLYSEVYLSKEGDFFLYDCIIGDKSASAPFKLVKKYRQVDGGFVFDHFSLYLSSFGSQREYLSFEGGADSSAVLEYIRDFEAADNRTIWEAVDVLAGKVVSNPLDFIRNLRTRLEAGDVDWLKSDEDKLLALGLAYYFTEEDSKGNLYFKSDINTHTKLNSRAVTDWILDFGNGYKVQIGRQQEAGSNEEPAAVISRPRAVSGAVEGKFVINSRGEEESYFYPYEMTGGTEQYDISFSKLSRLLSLPGFKEKFMELCTVSDPLLGERIPNESDYQDFIAAFQNFEGANTLTRFFVRAAAYMWEGLAPSRKIAADVLDALLEEGGVSSWSDEDKLNAAVFVYEVKNDKDKFEQYLLKYNLKIQGEAATGFTVFYPNRAYVSFWETAFDSIMTLWQGKWIMDAPAAIVKTSTAAKKFLGKLIAQDAANLSAQRGVSAAVNVGEYLASKRGIYKLLAKEGSWGDVFKSIFKTVNPEGVWTRKTFSGLIANMERVGIFGGLLYTAQAFISGYRGVEELWQSFKLGFVPGMVAGFGLYGFNGFSARLLAKLTAGKLVPQGVSYLLPTSWQVGLYTKVCSALHWTTQQVAAWDFGSLLAGLYFAQTGVASILEDTVSDDAAKYIQLGTSILSLFLLSAGNPPNILGQGPGQYRIEKQTVAHAETLANGEIRTVPIDYLTFLDSQSRPVVSINLSTFKVGFPTEPIVLSESISAKFDEGALRKIFFPQ